MNKKFNSVKFDKEVDSFYQLLLASGLLNSASLGLSESLNKDVIQSIINDISGSVNVQLELINETGRLDENIYTVNTRNGNLNIRIGYLLDVIDQYYHKSKYAISFPSFRDLLPSGFSLIDKIESALYCSTKTILNIVPNDCIPKSANYFGFDQLYYQVFGTQRIDIFDSVVESPIPLCDSVKFSLDNKFKILETELRPGDMLFVPKGYIVKSNSSLTEYAELIVNLYRPTNLKIAVDQVRSAGERINTMRECFWNLDLKGISNKESLFYEIKRDLITNIKQGSFKTYNQKQAPVKSFVSSILLD
ncbi:hypothetical protein SanaruYs_34870 [Chryseotalea sanaruensis]|uniref:JmjC domain-containing protein n=1 Tax=Chryseotalea sanaruensis TaxID=2482724 RepID=A0A401UEG7_9BACT|nr:hypothetical protein [Chryseotalea sanaruensis]GCC53244.1 hypothetical protein SanaruYs_34870 [Chryseotalea sanaruensis]